MYLMAQNFLTKFWPQGQAGWLAQPMGAGLLGTDGFWSVDLEINKQM